MTDNKGKRAPVELEEAPKAKKRQRCLEDIPTFKVGEVSLRAIEVLSSEAVKTASEAIKMVHEVAKAIERALEVSGARAKSIGRVAKMANIGYGMIATTN